MKYNKISPSDRKRVVEEDWKSLCKTLGINVKTASTWFEMKVEIPEKKGGKISKKSPEIIVSLLAKIEENASTTLLELKTLVFRDFIQFGCYYKYNKELASCRIDISNEYKRKNCEHE